MIHIVLEFRRRLSLSSANSVRLCSKSSGLTGGFTREYLRYVGRRSVVVDHLFRVKLQGRGLAYAAGAPARGAPLAWGRSFGEIQVLFFKIIYRYRYSTDIRKNV